jgi:hypothetical protein
MDGAVMTSETIPPSAIKKVWIDGESLEMFKGYFIACAMSHTLRCDIDYNPLQEKLGKILSKSPEALSELYEALTEVELVEHKA